MKSIILNSLFALIALISVNVAVAQNPHINPSNQDDVRVSGSFYTAGISTNFRVCCDNALITGIGNASTVKAQLVIQGTADSECFNGGNSVKSIPGQTITAKSELAEFTPDKNGNVTISGVCAHILGGCKSKGGSGWSSEVSNVNITSVILMINNKPVDLTSYYLAQNANPQ